MESWQSAALGILNSGFCPIVFRLDTGRVNRFGSEDTSSAVKSPGRSGRGPGLVPSSHVAAHRHVEFQFQGDPTASPCFLKHQHAHGT